MRVLAFVLANCMYVSLHACSYAYVGSAIALARARAFAILTVRVSAISCSIPCVGGGQQDHTGVCCDSPPMMIQMRRGMLLSIPMTVMLKRAYRDLRCFWQLLTMAELMLGISFSVQALVSVSLRLLLGIRRHGYYHCLGFLVPS